MSYRKPNVLSDAITEHKAKNNNEEPKLVMLRDRYVQANGFWFRSRLHTLCCGKGAIYDGIPAIVTPSAMVEDFLICY